MPIYKIKNENFFKKWSPDMAYILGFFTANGNMIKNKRGAHFIEFQITDRELLEKIKKIINSNHKITARKRDKKWKTSYRLQIGRKTIFNDLLKLGLTPNKSKTINLPNVLDKYFSHFTRGYFDGDGCVHFGFYNRKDRESKSYLLGSNFTSGSKKFLDVLLKKLQEYANIKGGCICCLKKNRGFQLNFSINDSKKLFQFMYSNVVNELFLNRKYCKFQKGLKFLESHIL